MSRVLDKSDLTTAPKFVSVSVGPKRHSLDTDPYVYAVAEDGTVWRYERQHHNRKGLGSTFFPAWVPLSTDAAPVEL